MAKKKDTSLGNIAQNDKKTKKNKRNWYSDRYIIAILQRNFFFIFAVASSIGMLICLLVIKNLNERKTIEPYILEVDKRTGIPTVVDTISLQQYTSQDIIKEYFIKKYLDAREGYNAATYQSQYYDVIRTMSSVPIYNAFKNFIENDNASPIKTLGQSGRRVVVISSLVYLGPNKVQIRLSDRSFLGDKMIGEQHYLLTMSFIFANLNLSLEERYINPLGFQVTEYNSLEEKMLY